MMVELVVPTPQDTIADPACGTCGFLVAAGEYLREHHPDLFHDEALRKHFHEGMFHAWIRQLDAAHRRDEHDPALRGGP